MTVDTFSTLKIIERTPTVCATGGCAGQPEAGAEHCDDWFRWERHAHSSKPQGFFDLVETVSPGPYVELFARAPRLGWDSWGYGYETRIA